MKKRLIAGMAIGLAVLGIGRLRYRAQQVGGNVVVGPFGEGYKPAEYEGQGATRYHQGNVYGRSKPKTNPPGSLWTDTDTPQTIDSGDTNALELRFKFQSDVSGSVTGLQFYKAATNPGKHTGYLWSLDGTMLAGMQGVGTAGNEDLIRRLFPVPFDVVTLPGQVWGAGIDSQRIFAIFTTQVNGSCRSGANETEQCNKGVERP